jgi:hypothetical protein
MDIPGVGPLIIFTLGANARLDTDIIGDDTANAMLMAN